MNLIKLAERVEAASGPDRELDALIWCALRGVKFVAWYDVYGRDSGRLTQVEYREAPRRAALVSNGRNVPHALPFTASLDAAMALMPEGARALIDSDGCHCRITKVDDDAWPSDGFTGFACTISQAVTAAALRALHAQENGDG